MSNWEHKLKNFQADPPPTAWEKIVSGLDQSQPQFPEKLYNYQQAPPPAAWQRLEQALPSTESKVVAMPRRNYWRYAAAAIFILAIAGIAYFTAPGGVQNSVAGTDAALQLNTAPAAPPVKRVLKHFNVPPQPADASPRTSGNSRPQYATLATPAKKPRQKQTHVSLPLEPAFAAHLDVVPQEKTIVDADRTERYMIATTDEGAPVRLPKKVYSAFACPDDEPTRKACELQLTLLQQKMSTSLTTDFAHFLDLIKNLQENTR